MATILLLEDDGDLAEIWTELLELKGHAVRAAGSLAELADLPLDGVDVAVIDWTLPDGSGSEAIEGMRRRGLSARLVITTGHGADLVPDGMSGADAVLRKPFRVGDLREVIGKLTSERPG